MTRGEGEKRVRHRSIFLASLEGAKKSVGELKREKEALQKIAGLFVCLFVFYFRKTIKHNTI